MKDPDKEIRDFLFYFRQREERWRHQDIVLKLIKNYAQNMLIGMEKASTGKFLSHEELQDQIRGTLKMIVGSIDGLKKMEGLSRETD